ncbi:MAG: SDR family NAD(P)-dependent oxidoreductase [Burkholderiaceae bacterium]|nr:SDR family NAD(P)-dependent oxidoreductase [Burkholderiaceae bacterium]
MKPTLQPINRQVIVITGATSGIGLATAKTAAERGAKLVLAARNDVILSDIVGNINSGGGEAIFVAADVSDREQVQRIADAAITHFGRIDTWVNNAGLSIYGRLREVSEKDHRRLFDINFWGIVHGSLAALPHLIRSGGALINLGSEASDAVVPLQGMYSATKHAVKGFTDALRVEVEKVDDAPVSITLVQPTAVNTPFPQHAKNYMEHEPKLPSPQIDPFQVAEAILDAATTPRSHVTVGAMAKVNTALFKILPDLAETLATKYASRQQYDEAPRDPEGALYRAGDDGQIYGSGPIPIDAQQDA